jgi:hypothetical protein
VALVALIGACGGDGAASGSGNGSGATTTRQDEPNGGQHVAGRQGGAAPAGWWQEVVPAGGCECAGGDEYRFWVHEGDPAKVVLFLQGGGACFTAETCAPDGELYRTTAEAAPHAEGLFDFDGEGNPFADYSVVYVPYCTGDVHLGTTTKDYGDGLTVEHKGFVNGSAALDRLATAFPDARQVVVAGESAGSVAAPLYGGLVADRLPDAQVTVVADSSGSYPDDPKVDALFTGWGTAAATPAWFDDRRLSPPGLVSETGRHHPDIVFARLDFAEDENQSSWFPYFGLPVGDLRARLAATEAQIEAAGVQVHSYVAPGRDHTVIGDADLLTETVDGQRLADWLAKLLAGEPVDDVGTTGS